MSTGTGKYSEATNRPTIEALTLVELLRWRASHQADRLAYTFLADGDAEEVNLTYGDLDRHARSIAARLQGFGATGKRALLLYPPGLDFIAGFFGCLYAGVVAVPVYPPHPSRALRTLPRLLGIALDAQASIAITIPSVFSVARLLFPQAADLESLRWLSIDMIEGEAREGEWQEPDITDDTLAFLQYTSGSTGQPKGVMLSHGNLLYNAAMVHSAVEHTVEDKYVSWLPTFHDMGFMAGVLQPLYAGIPVVSMSPASFLQRPLRWLDTISRYKATTSGGPNFAYDLCARKITPEQRSALDLSTWTVAFNGAEPIRKETLERFAAAFEPCGFDKKAFYPCYGLAEATLIVSGGLKASPPLAKSIQAKALESNRAVDPLPGDDSKSLIDCGAALLDQKIVIADPQSLGRCGPGEIGEIWVSGPNVAKGYWNRPDETERIFHARLSDTGEGPFLRTEDLGFMQDGKLFVTGRLKDLIIIRGRNHYPHDIELTVEQCHPALRQGCGAAFSIELDGEERLALVHEIEFRKRPDLDAVIDNIRQAVAEAHELQAGAIVLVNAGTILKTSSGKIQRRACKAAFLEGKLDVLKEWRGETERESISVDPVQVAPPGEAEGVTSWLISRAACRLGLHPSAIDVTQPLTRYGIDSLIAIELAHDIESNLGVALPAASLLQSCSILQLEAEIAESSRQDSSAPSSLVDSAQSAAAEYPLSYGQKALWFIHQVAPESSAYNIAAALRIQSEVDGPALRRAFQKLIDRHASLRTTFVARDGEPFQRISEEAQVHFIEKDASSWSEDFLNESIATEAHLPFDLEHGPLLRLTLFARAAQEPVLLLTMHHIVTDFWSIGVLVRELGIIYDAEKSGLEASLAPLDLRYTDFTRWQQEAASSEAGERHKEYWLGKLAGELPILNLGLNRARLSVPSYDGASYYFRLGADLTRRLRAVARANETTLNTVLLTAFQVLLHRYTGQKDIIVGSPTTGRTKARLAGLVGYFVNPVLIRTDLSGDPSFESLLRQVRQTAIEAFDHQDYPFPLLLQHLQSSRDAGKPLPQVMFVLQKAQSISGEDLASFTLGESETPIRLGELKVKLRSVAQRASQFDLSLMMAEANAELAGSFQYNTDLFEASTIQRMADQFIILLQAICSDPLLHISDLPLLSQAQRHLLLVDYNQSSSPVPLNLCVHHLFQAQAALSPHALALVCQDRSLTYDQLNRLSNRLAHRLISSGVGPESLVGLCTHRSPEMIVAMLAILKAGGAYVPLDPAYPADRIRLMREDAGISVIVTQKQEAGSVQTTGCEIVMVDDYEALSRQSEDDPEVSICAGNAAYVIYTSGSTGSPKGVVVTHAGLLNLIYWHQNTYNVSAEDRASQVARMTFDASVWEIWPYLTKGASLYLPNDEVRTSPSELLDWLIANAITICFLPTPLAESVLSLDWPDDAPLKFMLVGGDRLHRHPKRQLSFDLVNHYGPTEYTVVATSALVAPSSQANTMPPIGYPIANTQAYILDNKLNPVPVGFIGQLFISGAGLARGYLFRPDLTASSFIPNPFSSSPGDRLYSTGDLVRFLPDLSIDFVGRSDLQVKIRGFRIELGEIEAAMRAHPLVEQALVIATDQIAADKRLVAYFVSSCQHEELTAAHLRAHLKRLLPDYMVPSYFVRLEELALTANGKINREGLPLPDQSAGSRRKEGAAQSSPLEEVIAGIWGEVLGVEEVFAEDNFFELGGHSLLATQVISRIRESLNVEVPLRSLLETPTVAGLAREIEKARNNEGRNRPSEIAPVSRKSRRMKLSSLNVLNQSEAMKKGL